MLRLVAAGCCVGAAPSSSNASPPQRPPSQGAFGSGDAGSWLDDAAGLPCYRLHPTARLPNTWESGFQLGNDRLAAL